MTNTKRRAWLAASTLLKYGITVLFILLNLMRGKTLPSLLGGCELIIAILVTELLLRRKRALGIIWNILTVLLINAELTILMFSGTFLEMIMLSNLDSLAALSGRGLTYAAFGTLAVLGGLLPVTSLGQARPRKPVCAGIITALLAVDIGFCAAGVNGPLTSLYGLGRSAYQHVQLTAEISRKQESGADTWPLARFARATVGDSVARQEALTERPNILLIFTEGLSQHIIEDERDIMPNLRAYEAESLTFERYFNHTAATYRGLIGQLFSGHQFNNTDSNQLISLQSILRDQGYHTAFLNAEPGNDEFSDYLRSMGFDQVIDGPQPVATDKEMYELMYQTLAAAGDEPQLLAMYTYWTHVSYDSPDIIYGDGSDRLLNKFHNVDAQFGHFMAQLRESGLSKDTIVVFTADHATYSDDDFQHTFDSVLTRDDTFCDRIPLFIWYEGVTPSAIDAGGRNSLGLAPTLLDFLDIDAPNYFLGNSLFQADLSPREWLVNTTFAVPESSDWKRRTVDGVICGLALTETLEMNELLTDYFACSLPLRNE